MNASVCVYTVGGDPNKRRTLNYIFVLW